MKPIKEGKVREIYDNGDSLIMVATDRISCFDVILNYVVTNKGTVKQVNYDVKTDTTSVVEKASDSVVGVVVYKNTTNNAFGFGDNSSSSSETQSGSGSGVVYDLTGKYTYIITNQENSYGLR